MARRGENIRKRKDGRWEGRYIKGRKPDHTAIWGYIYGHSYAVVKRELTVRKNELQEFALSASNPTFRELSQNWEGSIFLGVKPSTAAHYHYTLQHYILPVIGSLRVKALSEVVLEHGLLEIISPADNRHKPLGHTMARECLILVRRICRYAVHQHFMRPLEINLKLPRLHSSMAVLNQDEQKRVCLYVAQAATPRRIGVLLMMQMGLRIGEVCGLQWQDFDLDSGILSVRRTVKRIYVENQRTKVVVQSPKTATSERAIPIPRKILALVRQLYNSQSPRTWFLSSQEAKPVEPRCYSKSIHCYLKHAQVSAVHPHALRHTFATTCLQRGCNLKTLSEMMGHASSDITMKLYVHTCWDWKRAEIDRIFNN